MPVAGKQSSRQNEDDAKVLDIVIKRGDTLNFTYEANYIDSAGDEQPYDFTGCTLKAHIKKKKTDDIPYRAIALTTASNVITFYMNSEALKIPADIYFYDIEMEDADGYHTTILKGKFKVTQDVTEWLDDLVEYYTHKFATAVKWAIIPSSIFTLPAFLTSFSVLITLNIKKIFTAVFGTKFTSIVLPHVIMNSIFKTKWSFASAPSLTFAGTFGTTWGGVVTPYG